MIVAASREFHDSSSGALRRQELRRATPTPVLGAEADARRTILQRFAVSREVLQEAASDVFHWRCEENWQEPLRAARPCSLSSAAGNRAAIENRKSPYASLEDAMPTFPAA